MDPKGDTSIRRRWVAGLVVLVTVGATGAGLEWRRARGAACAPERALVLELAGVYRTELPIPPRAIAPLGDSLFLAVGPDGALTWLGAPVPGPGLGLDLQRIYRGVSGSRGLALAYTDNEVFGLPAGSDLWRTLAIDDSLRMLRIAEPVGDGRTLWLVAGSAREIQVTRAERGTGSEYRPGRVWHLDGNWRLRPREDGSALAFGTRLPFEVVRLGPDEAVEVLGRVADSPLFRAFPDSAAPFVVGAVSLDCDRVLLTVADLRSPERRLVALDAANGAVLKITAMQGTLGFFASRPERRVLFGYRDTTDGGEVLVYRWTWQDQHPGTRASPAEGGEP
ncbi:MAG: hypothetical protein D6701_11705 [Gemmatimonadetes bacterium]|nr:MAG: hypothetical protein D6701_11705 [Gemmatimonadota bacterium]